MTSRPERAGLRVGMVCPYSLDSHGGVQQHVAGLAAALRTRGHDVAVLAPGDTGRDRPGPVTTLGEGSPVPFNGSVAPVRLGPRREVRRWLADGDFDVVHVHEPAAPSTSYTAVRALLDTDVPVVATHHIAMDRAWALRLAAPTLLRAVLARVDAHVVVSREARRTLERYHRVPATLLPNGLDTAAFAPVDATSPGPALSGRRDVVFLGRPEEPRKGFEVLARAVPEVLAARPGARLVVVGGPTDLADLPRELAALLAPLGDRLVLAGRVTDAEKVAHLRRARVLVAPNTRGESFGIVLAEAMAAGLPVVASDLPAFRAVLDDGALGLLATPGDPVALAAAVTRVLTDDALARHLAAEAAAAARSRFDWSVVAPGVLGVYAEAGARAGAGRESAHSGTGAGLSVGSGRPSRRTLGA